MPNFDAAFFHNMDQEVDRICMLLLEAYLAQWSRSGAGGTKDLQAYDQKVEAARKRLFPTVEDPAVEEETETWVSGLESEPVLEDMPVHLAYWFEAKAHAWRTRTEVEHPPVSPAELQSLLEQARVIQKRLRSAHHARSTETDRQAQTESWDSTALRTRTQRCVATIERVVAIGEAKPKEPRKPHKKKVARRVERKRRRRVGAQT